MNTLYRIMPVALLLLPLAFFGQVYLGQDEMSPYSEHVDPAPYFGEDFSGGYQVGDTVANFQIYAIDGQAVRLSDILNEGKYTIINSGSATCVRFVETFNTEATDPGYQVSRQYMTDHADDFSWIFLYGYEAHPGDIENCTSNCPDITIPAPNGDTLYQHEVFADRLDAIHVWQDIIISELYAYDFPFTMYADNPDNGVYNNFLQRPFGNVVIDCQGIVVARCDWTNLWLAENGGIEFLDGLLDQGWTCPVEAYECIDSDLDSDFDGICDRQELWQGWDPFDANDPEDTSTAIDLIEANTISVYPNPFDQNITIIGVSADDLVQIWDMHGRLVESMRLSGSAQLSMGHLGSGVYTMTVTTSEGLVSTQRIVRR